MRGGFGVKAGGADAGAGAMGVEEGEDGVSYEYAMSCLERGLILLSTNPAAVTSARGAGGVGRGGGSGGAAEGVAAGGGEGDVDGGAGAEERAKVGQGEKDREAKWKMTQVRIH
jgi:hypothetical protein